MSGDHDPHLQVHSGLLYRDDLWRNPGNGGCGCCDPQCVIFLAIFAAAKFIFPLTTPDMIADFKACGGFLLLATGFRIAKDPQLPVADMIPAMVLDK